MLKKTFIIIDFGSVYGQVLTAIVKQLLQKR